MAGLGVHHEYLLCSLADVDGKALVHGHHAAFGLAGALVAEMQTADRLVPVKANVFALRPGPLSPGALGMAEQRLEGSQLSMERCIGSVAHSWFSGIAPIRTRALDELHAMGIVGRVQDRFLFIPWRMRYPEVDGEVEDALRQRMRAHLERVGDGDAPERDDLLLSLLRVTKLLTNIWTEAEVERLRPRIEERTKRAPIGKIVRKLVRDAEAAAAAAAAAGASFSSPAALLED